MIIALIILFCLTILQNASFTLVSRARNSGSYLYNALASVGSNGIWFVVVQQVIAKPNDLATGITYVIGATIGSVLMQWVAIRFLEKKKPVVVKEQVPTIGRIVTFLDHDAEAWPALISKVWDNKCVDVFILGKSLERRTSVLKGDLINQWSWPKIVK